MFPSPRHELSLNVISQWIGYLVQQISKIDQWRRHIIRPSGSFIYRLIEYTIKSVGNKQVIFYLFALMHMRKLEAPPQRRLD